MRYRRPNTADRGRHTAIIRNPQKPDWPVDGQEHVFGTGPDGFSCMIVTKGRDGRLDIQIQGPFDRTFVFVIPMQPNVFQENGIHIACEWSDGEVRLFINKHPFAVTRKPE
jgi:hypothetical protein